MTACACLLSPVVSVLAERTHAPVTERFAGCDDGTPRAHPGRAAAQRTAVAALLGVEPDTVYAWARAGELPCLRLGPRCLRWTRPLLEEWLAGRRDNGRP